MEQYIYLGTQNDTHFFIHTIFNPLFVPEISHEIYNMLIKDKIITKPQDCVVIYEINPKDKVIDVVCIQNPNNSRGKANFDKQNLESFFPVLIKYKSETDSIYVITYNYTHYTSYIMTLDISKYTSLNKSSINIRNIIEIAIAT